MTYRDERQSIQDPAEQILEGVEKLDRAIALRLREGDWVDEHEQELIQLKKDLLDWEIRLRKLAKENW